MKEKIKGEQEFKNNLSFRIGVIDHKDSDYYKNKYITVISFDVDKPNKNKIEALGFLVELIDFIFDIKKIIVYNNILRNNFNVVVFVENPIFIEFYFEMRSIIDDKKRLELDVKRFLDGKEFGRIFKEKKNDKRSIKRKMEFNLRNFLNFLKKYNKIL